MEGPLGRELLLAAGGALGSVARDRAGAWALRLLGPRAPRAGTFTVNVAGGFTTSSSFSLDAALNYAVASVVLSVSALFIGLAPARRLFA